jgi:hypothetical protein
MRKDKRRMKSLSKAIVFTAGILIISISACRKCTVCEIKDSGGNIIVEDEKVCGSATDRARAETDAEIRAELVGGTYICKEE